MDTQKLAVKISELAIGGQGNSKYYRHLYAEYMSRDAQRVYRDLHKKDKK